MSEGFYDNTCTACGHGSEAHYAGKGHCCACPAYHRCVRFNGLNRGREVSSDRVGALNEQVQALLEANTRLVEERRSVDLHAMVTQFHHAGASVVRHSPQVPPDTEVRFRLRLIAEEFFEQFDHIEMGALQKQLIADARERVRQVIDIGPIHSVDLPKLVDDWADLKYVIVGSEVQFGVDGNAVFRVVHEANMRKFGEGAWRDENGKTQKPPGWTPPDIAGELERQRREEAKRT